MTVFCSCDPVMRDLSCKIFASYIPNLEFQTSEKAVSQELLLILLYTPMDLLV